MAGDVVSFYSIAERQQALIVARLESIRVSNGYLADMVVYQERAHFDESDVFPLINVQTPTEVPDSQSGDRVTITRTWRIEIWRNDESESGTALCQDVKRALMVSRTGGALEDEDGKLGLLVYGGTESIADESGGRSLSGMLLTWSVTCPETWGEPRTAT